MCSLIIRLFLRCSLKFLGWFLGLPKLEPTSLNFCLASSIPKFITKVERCRLRFFGAALSHPQSASPTAPRQRGHSATDAVWTTVRSPPYC
ncbi:hypothetical protein HMPREF9228_0124 [Bifidobacterium breve ACS-071-V-Sch8b]|nr:hypothetical protein HMPREF9228_0124 [Bifidobacterium breve ACS-071-V-Sch8b]